MNKLFFGDNLEILRQYVPDGSVDLIYLDPPFNSKLQYNVLFQTPRRDEASAQAGAFRDTWMWGEDAEWSYREIMKIGGGTARFIEALRSALGESDMMAYLVMMAVRLDALHKKLKPTGSLYLHCDPTAAHYLKILLDGIFGPDGFANEIIWQRSMGKALMTKRLPTNHDVLLLYGGKGRTWNDAAMFQAYDATDLSAKTLEKYSQIDATGRRYQLTSLINPSQNRPNLTYEFLGVTKVWRWTKAGVPGRGVGGGVVALRGGRP